MANMYINEHNEGIFEFKFIFTKRNHVISPTTLIYNSTHLCDVYVVLASFLVGILGNIDAATSSKFPPVAE